MSVRAASVVTAGRRARMRERKAWLAVNLVPVVRRSTSTNSANVASASGDRTSSRLMVGKSREDDRAGAREVAGSGATGAAACSNGATSGPRDVGGEAMGPTAPPAADESRSLARDEVGGFVESILAMVGITQRVGS